MLCRQIIICSLLHQPGKASTVLVGGESWSDRPDPSELVLGRFGPTARPPPGSLSPEGPEAEEAEDEAALVWVIENCCLVKQSGVII